LERPDIKADVDQENRSGYWQGCWSLLNTRPCLITGLAKNATADAVYRMHFFSRRENALAGIIPCETAQRRWRQALDYNENRKVPIGRQGRRASPPNRGVSPYAMKAC